MYALLECKQHASLMAKRLLCCFGCSPLQLSRNIELRTRRPQVFFLELNNVVCLNVWLYLGGASVSMGGRDGETKNNR